ncbi:hypothetical protein Hte_002549 [Hypoxylon texense]
MSASDIQPLLENVAKARHSLTIACINSPANVTISGDRDQLEELAAILEQRQIFHRRLRVGLAYHSPMMGTASVAYKQDAGVLEPGTPDMATGAIMVSSVTGKVVDALQLQKVEYWVQNMLQPVLFSEAVSSIWHSGESPSGSNQATSIPATNPVDILVEVGPHPALQSPIREIFKSPSTAGVPSYYYSMRRHTPVHRHLLTTFGYLSCHGVKLNFGLLNSLDAFNVREHRRSRRVIKNLPEYPFDHSCTYLPTGRLGKSFRFRKHAKLDLLGKPVVDWNPLQPRWRNFVKQSELPWINDHKINDTVIYPAVGMLAMAIEAANQLADQARTINGFKLTDAFFMVALAVPASPQGIETQLSLSPSPGSSDRNSSSWKFRLFSHDGAQWQEHCHGTVSIDYVRRPNDLEGREDLEILKHGQTVHDAISQSAILRRTKNEFYDSLFKSGYTFGPAFRAMDDIIFNDRCGRQATASINCFDWREVDGCNHFQQHVVHPTTLDGILQVSIAAFTRAGEDVVSTAIPAEIEYLWVAKDGLSFPDAEIVRSAGTLISQGNIGYETSVIALDDSRSRVTLEAKGIKLRFVTGAASAQDQARHPPLPYSFQWKPDIDLLKPETHLSTTGIQGMECEGGLTDAQTLLTNFLDLLTFKKPNMKILHLANSDADDEKILLEKLFRSQGVSGPTFPCLELVSREVGLWTAEPTKINAYDLIIDSHSLDTLYQAHQSLKPGGKLVRLFENGMKCDQTRENAPQLHNLGFQLAPNGEKAYKDSGTSNMNNNRDLEQAGFTNISRYTADPANTAMLITASKPCRASSPKPPKPPMSYIIVIEATQFQDEMARILKRALESASLPCTVRYLDQLHIAGDNSQQICIFISELEHPLLQNLSPELFSKLRYALISTKGLLWVASRDEGGLLPPGLAMVDGLARVLRSENELAVIVTAAFAHARKRDQAEKIMTLVQATDFGTKDQSYESSYLQVDDGFRIGRLRPMANLSETIFDESSPYQSKLLSLSEAPALRLAIATPGLLDTLYFHEDISVEEPLPPGWVEIRVVAVGLNFKDLLLALGRENGTTFGNECAGVVHRVGAGATFQIGERVCTFSPTAFSTYTRVEADKVARVPESISLAHAAAVPTQFVTSWYALHNAAKVQKGESVLIHSAAGGTGQAALQVAKLLGAVVFATVGSEEKKRFLVKRYGISEDRIFYSRSTTFAKGILRLTNGRGVDVVINSLSGEELLASWDIIAPLGRFIELGKKDIAANNSLPMRPFLRRATFTALEIGAMAAEFGPLGKQIIDQVLDLFAKGSLRPVEAFQVLPISKIQEGMRILQSGQSIGKIVFEMAGDEPVPVRIRSKSTWYLDETKTYVIAGGTGGLGLMIADWMVKEKGARNLLLLSRSGLRNVAAHAQDRVRKLRRLGAVIEAPECDITDVNALRTVVEGYRGSMPPISGCIQSSMVLRDTVFANMSFEDWEASTNPKTRGSWNLHSVLPKGLDFFILLSSISGIVGSAGQANYAAGNTYMDALAHYRNALGERATALDLGVVVDHGFLAANETLRNRILSAGLLRGIGSSELLALLDHCCAPTSPHTTQIAIGLAPASELKVASPHSNPSFFSLPFYQHVFAGAGEANVHASREVREEVQRKQDFAAAQTLSDAGTIVSQALLQRLISMSPGLQDRVDAKNLDEPIQTFGVDSLQAIELRSWFAREFAADIPIFAILGDETLASIGLLVAAKSKLRVA